MSVDFFICLDFYDWGFTQRGDFQRFGSKMAQVEKTWLTFQLLELDPVTFFLTLSSKLLIESWCSISESVYQISDYGFKCLARSVIWANKSECVAKLRFSPVLRWWFFLVIERYINSHNSCKRIGWKSGVSESAPRGRESANQGNDFLPKASTFCVSNFDNRVVIKY